MERVLKVGVDTGDNEKTGDPVVHLMLELVLYRLEERQEVSDGLIWPLPQNLQLLIMFELSDHFRQEVCLKELLKVGPLACKRGVCFDTLVHPVSIRRRGPV